MHKTVKTTIQLIDGQSRYETAARELEAFSIDYAPPTGQGQGYNSLELFLLSLSSCAATTMVSLLRNKMKRTVTDIRAEAVGDVREKHPKGFEHIRLIIEIASPDATGEEAETALQVTEEKLCPVWAMIRGNVKVEAQVRLRQDS